MRGKGVNGVKSGGAGADPVAEGVGDGEGDCGGGDAANPLGATELPLVELGLLGASRRENNGVPSGNPRRMPHRQPQMVPRFPQNSFEIRLLSGSRKPCPSLGFHFFVFVSWGVSFPRK